MPRIQRNTAQPGALAPIPTAESFGAGEARGLQAVSQGLREVAEVGRRVNDGYQRQKVYALATDAEDELRRYTEELAQEPDFQRREQLFLERYQEVRDRYSEEFVGPYKASFHTILAQSRNRHGQSVRAQAREDEMAAAEILANRSAEQYATMAATSSDPLDQEVARIAGESVYRDLASTYGVDEAHLAETLRKFHRSVDDAILVERLRNDPVDAYRQLSVPEQGLAMGRTELERQKLITTAVDTIERNLITRESSERALHAQRERERKIAAANAQRSFVADANTPDGLSLETVMEFEDVLDPSEFREWMQWVHDTGGRMRRSKTNPLVYQELRDRAMAGEDVTSAIYAAERDGDLLGGDRNALLSLGEESRFAPAEEYLAEALKVGELANNPALRARNARAKLFFDEWKMKNPNATLGEAIEAAEREVRRAMVFDAAQIPIAQTPPRFAVTRPDGSIDAEETRLELMRRRQAGEITSDEELDRELDLVDRLDRAQRAQAERQRLKSAGGEP